MTFYFPEARVSPAAGSCVGPVWPSKHEGFRRRAWQYLLGSSQFKRQSPGEAPKLLEPERGSIAVHILVHHRLFSSWLFEGSGSILLKMTKLQPHRNRPSSCTATPSPAGTKKRRVCRLLRCCARSTWALLLVGYTFCVRASDSGMFRV